MNSFITALGCRENLFAQLIFDGIVPCFAYQALTLPPIIFLNKGVELKIFLFLMFILGYVRLSKI